MRSRAFVAAGSVGTPCVLLEQKQLTWDNTAALQLWWDRALDNLKSKTAAAQHKYQQPVGGGNNNGNYGDKPKKTHLAGVSITWMQENAVCMKFQTGTCTESGPHTTARGNTTLKHVCAGCMKLGKPDDPSHCAKSCPNKAQFFQ